MAALQACGDVRYLQVVREKYVMAYPQAAGAGA